MSEVGGAEERSDDKRVVKRVERCAEGVRDSHGVEHGAMSDGGGKPKVLVGVEEMDVVSAIKDEV